PRNPKESWYRPADHPRPTAPHSAASQNNRVDGNTKSPIHGFRLSPAQRKLSSQMVSYWSQFVTTGAPKVSGQPAWPPLGGDPARSPRMSLRPDGSRVETNFAESHQCRFWSSLKGKR
ncbi:carboxylesterase family protein, partial [Mycobacterium xenopi]